MPPLPNQRQERFAQELADGKTAIDAYEAAGYKRSAANASHLQSEHKVSQRVAELQEKRAEMARAATEKAVEKLALTKEWVIGRLMANAERALQNVPVLDTDGQPVGEYRYEGSVANRALEILAKHLGILVDKVEHTGADGGPIETSDVSGRVLVEQRVTALAKRGPTVN